MFSSKRLARVMSAITLSVFLALSSLPVQTAGAGASTTTPIPRSAPVKIAVISDPHYYDDSLGTSGSAWQQLWYSDNKMRAESAAILDSTINSIKDSDAQIVLVAGDLTNDGELISHQDIANRLEQLKAAGKKVYVIDGNHDIDNFYAASYSGSTATPVAHISRDDFKSIYHDFGYGEAVAVDPYSLSYAVDPVPGLRIICMDSALYASNSLSNPSETDGSLEAVDAGSSTRLDWIDQEIDDGVARGDTVIGMEHHPLTNHFVGNSEFFPDFVLDDAANVAAKLASHGMHVVFTGHFHTNDITEVPNQDLFDVETGSLVTYPAPYRYVELTPDNQLKVTTQTVASINYNPPGNDFMPYNNTYPNFQTYARDTCNIQQEVLIPYMLAEVLEAPPYSMPPGNATTVGTAVYTADNAVNQTVAPGLNVNALISDAMLDNRAGDESPSLQAQAIYQYLIHSGNPLNELLGSFCQNMDADLFPADNNIDLNLNTGQAASTLVADALSYTLSPGGTHQTVATFIYSNGSTEDVSSQATYSSSNPAVAKVTASGLVSAITPGSTVITAVYGAATVASAVYDSNTGTYPESRTAYAVNAGATNQEQILVNVVSSGGGSSGGGSSGGENPTSTVSTPGSTAVDPSAGGSVGLDAEATLVIPAGALQGNTAVEVAVRQMGAPPAAAPSGFRILGSAYEFTVGGQDSYSFAKPVTLTLFFDPSGLAAGETPAIYYYNIATSQWVNLGGTVSGNTITVSVDHFTQFAVLVKEATSSSGSTAPVFSDVPVSNWAYAAINKLSSLSYIGGYPDGAFRPNGAITRAELVSIMGKVLKPSAYNPATPDFRDISPSDWFYGSVESVSHAGVLQGYGNHLFAPDNPITREELACVLIQSLGKQDQAKAAMGKQTSFADDASISSWARGFVEVAVNDGLIKGDTDNRFRPQGSATRAEACAMINNYLGVQQLPDISKDAVPSQVPASGNGLTND